MKPQEQMREKLAQAGIPHKAIECYGSQIVVTALCAESAARWSTLLGQFATVRGTVKTVDEVKDPSGYFAANPGLVKSFFTQDVWRVFAAI